MMFVIKADGRREKFSMNKIIRTCMRAGMPKKDAFKIAKKIKSEIKNNTTTRVIYHLILDELEKRKIPSSFIYRLRDSIAELGPIEFELYTKKILEAHGYRCEWNKIIPGKCIEHQIDVIAKKEKLFLVECKRHFNPHRFTGLGVVLQLQATLEDLLDGFEEKKNKYRFDQAWLVINTKFSEHAKQYAGKKNIRLTGWRSNTEFSLERMIEKKKIYPITILNIDFSLQKKFLSRHIITIDDLLGKSKKYLSDKFNVHRRTIDDLIRQSKELKACVCVGENLK
jgi:HJR/Mrr/RecB family endonuclease